MKSALILSFLFSLILISSCGDKAQMDKNRRFVKHTSVEWAGLKGKVRSIVSYRFSLADSTEHYDNIQKVKFNAEGFLVEEIDTIAGRSFYVYKYFYNEDGLLAKAVYAPSEPYTPSVDTYLYSYEEGKKTCISRNPDSSLGSADTSVSLYDKNGNELEYNGRGTKRINIYDERGFLTKTTYNGAKPFEVSYENDDKGRILKQSWSDGRGAQTHAYNSDGNEIGEANFDSTGRKTSESFTGYCEFDKNGNYLKSITICPRIKYAYMTRRVIEYY